MRVLLANKFYYSRGGDCIYMMNVENILREKGHDVSVFSMQYSKNEKSEWSKYWPKNMSKVDALTRPLGFGQVVKKFSQLLKDFQPNVVHLNNIHTQLSPVIAKIAHEAGIRVLWTLHDTKLVCPCYTCMRSGKWCTECFEDRTAVVRHRCMPGGLLGSIIGYLEALRWNKNVIQECVDLFLSPSQFMVDTCVEGGYRRDKFRVLCNFIDVKKIPQFSQIASVKRDYYVYLGRISAVKGVKTLCRVAAMLQYKLVVIGDGELLPELQYLYGSNNNIEFLGKKPWKEIAQILHGARFMVLPAEWSENNPLTIIESHSLGTPVLGARIGGIPELIEEGFSGDMFVAGDAEDLKRKIEMMFTHSFDYDTIAKKSVERYSSEIYYKKLIEYYKG